MGDENNVSTSSTEVAVKKPQKKYYRQRAHSNPWSDHCLDYPTSPDTMDWTTLYPKLSSFRDPVVRFADIGCGYGGLLVAMAKIFPDTLMLGLELRVKVSDYVADRIQVLRKQREDSASSINYQNIACLRSNAMKYLPNFFKKGQLTKLFFLYPDPHFKRAKHKWRIINMSLIAEYAYVLQVGVGLIYTITDVYDLYEWIVSHFKGHPLFEQLTDEELEKDPIVDLIYDSTEEGQKVSRADGQKWCAVFRRVIDPSIEKLKKIGHHQ